MLSSSAVIPFAAFFFPVRYPNSFPFSIFLCSSMISFPSLLPHLIRSNAYSTVPLAQLHTRFLYHGRLLHGRFRLPLGNSLSCSVATLIVLLALGTFNPTSVGLAFHFAPTTLPANFFFSYVYDFLLFCLFRSDLDSLRVLTATSRWEQIACYVYFWPRDVPPPPLFFFSEAYAFFLNKSLLFFFFFFAYP